MFASHLLSRLAACLLACTAGLGLGAPRLLAQTTTTAAASDAEVKGAERLFQLAFILLNLPSIQNENHGDRELVELIFLPTGGGKTQAAVFD